MWQCFTFTLRLVCKSCGLTSRVYHQKSRPPFPSYCSLWQDRCAAEAKAAVGGDCGGGGVCCSSRNRSTEYQLLNSLSLGIALFSPLSEFPFRGQSFIQEKCSGDGDFRALEYPVRKQSSACTAIRSGSGLRALWSLPVSGKGL